MWIGYFYLYITLILVTLPFSFIWMLRIAYKESNRVSEYRQLDGMDVAMSFAGAFVASVFWPIVLAGVGIFHAINRAVPKLNKMFKTIDQMKGQQ